MVDIDDMYESVKRLDLRRQIPIIIENTADQILMLNAAQMYQQNVDGDGAKITPEYRSDSYEEMKIRMNPNLGPGEVDLFLTGAFYNSRELVVTQEDYFIEAYDNKASDLLEKYGERILELTEESKTEYAESVLEQSIKLYIETTSLLKLE